MKEYNNFISSLVFSHFLPLLFVHEIDHHLFYSYGHIFPKLLKNLNNIKIIVKLKYKFPNKYHKTETPLFSLYL